MNRDTLDPEGTGPLPQLKVPPQVGHYRILEELGEGACGVVHKALDQQTPYRRLVAIKFFKGATGTLNKRLKVAAERIFAMLPEDEHIARLYEVGEEYGVPYLVMELVEGVSITRYCAEHRLNPKQRLDLFNQACAGLVAAHQQDFLHLDLKPENILVTERNGRPVVKLVDFGLAELRVDKGECSIGTPGFMSPEAVLGGLADELWDVYSMGKVLRELLVGEEIDASYESLPPSEEVSQ